MTDNGGDPYNNTDVDNGNTILASPIFDGTIYQNPVLSYYRRFLDINGLGTPNDSMKIRISNGSTSVVVENVLSTAAGNGTWVFHSVNLAGLITQTTTMQITIEVADIAPGNICEGAFDKFEVTGNLIDKLPELNPIVSLSAYPNPFSNDITIRYKLDRYDASTQMTISDISGRIIDVIAVSGSEGTIKTGQHLSAGLYFLNLTRNTPILKMFPL